MFRRGKLFGLHGSWNYDFPSFQKMFKSGFSNVIVTFEMLKCSAEVMFLRGNVYQFPNFKCYVEMFIRGNVYQFPIFKCCVEMFIRGNVWGAPLSGPGNGPCNSDGPENAKEIQKKSKIFRIKKYEKYSHLNANLQKKMLKFYQSSLTHALNIAIDLRMWQ